MLNTLIGAVLALLGGWLAESWRHRHATQSLAKALLIEFQASLSAKETEAADTFYRGVLDNWTATGEIVDRAALKLLIDLPLDQRYPVYAANVAAIGSLPRTAAERVVRFHSLTTGLIGGARMLIASPLLSPAQIQPVAYSLLRKYDEMVEARGAAIEALQATTRRSPWADLLPWCSGD